MGGTAWVSERPGRDESGSSTSSPAAPSGIAIIGAGNNPDTFTQHYYDSRGVARIYQMTLNGGV